jgi:hypothetical protein
MGFSLQGLLLAPDGCSSRSPCPRAVPRVGSPLPMGSGRTRSASGPRSRCELVRRAPLRARAPMPSWGFPLQGVRPLRPGHRFGSRGLPLRATRRDVHDRARPGVFGHGEIGWSLSGLPALLGFSALRPSRRRVRSSAGGGLMDSPHGSRALQAARTDLCPLDADRPRSDPRPGAAVLRRTAGLPLPFVRACLSKKAGPARLAAHGAQQSLTAEAEPSRLGPPEA